MRFNLIPFFVESTSMKSSCASIDPAEQHSIRLLFMSGLFDRLFLGTCDPLLQIFTSLFVMFLLPFVQIDLELLLYLFILK